MKWAPRKGWARLKRAKVADIPINWDDIPIRIDPRIEDDEWHLEHVLSAPEDAWQDDVTPPVPDHPMCGFHTPMGTGHTWYIPEDREDDA